MNKEEFLSLLCRFAERPMPALVGRHVYLWHGDQGPLRRVLPGHTGRTLDLYALAASLSQAPSSMDWARHVLLRAIRPQIADLLSSDRQQVLMVTGCDLLSRYRVPLGSFFEIASEHTAVVFAVSPTETYFQPTDPLPEYVSLNPHAPLDYLRGVLGEGAMIGTIEESS